MTTDLQQLAEYYSSFFETQEQDDRNTYVRETRNTPFDVTKLITLVHQNGDRDTWKYKFLLHSLEVIADTDLEFYEYVDNLDLDPTPYVALQWVASTTDKSNYVELAFNHNLGLERTVFDFLEVVKDGYACELAEIFYYVLDYLQKQVGEY